MRFGAGFGNVRASGQRDGHAPLPRRKLAEFYELPEPYLAKVLKQLVTAGMLGVFMALDFFLFFVYILLVMVSTYPFYLCGNIIRDVISIHLII